MFSDGEEKIVNKTGKAIMKGVPKLKKNVSGQQEDSATVYYYQIINYFEAANTDDIPYISAVKQFTADKKANHDRVLIISDEPGIAREAVSFLSCCPFDDTAYEIDEDGPFIEDDFFEDEYYDEDDEDEDEDILDQSMDVRIMFRELDFSGSRQASSSMENPYHRDLHLSFFDVYNLYVTGLENPEDREKKIESLVGQTVPSLARIMILVPRSEWDSLWVRNLIRKEGYSVIELPDCTEYLRALPEREGVDIDPETAKTCFQYARTDLGKELTEGDIVWYLTNPDVYRRTEKPAIDCLMEMTGLGDAKRVGLELVALEHEKLRNPSLGAMRKHMVFAGSPGTGKTTVASILARILAETGNSKAVCVTVSRADLIGKFVGHTAPKVAAKFQEARGGVLFVDEAGFFLSDRMGGGYTTEAIREFVRFMELYDDVTVIFAMYRDEVERFLALDEGLRSRICRQVEFKPYTDAELVTIMHTMCSEHGYRLDPKSEPDIREYLKEQSNRAAEKFGNAREVRKLTESSIICHAMRLDDEPDSEEPNLLTAEDVREGIQRLK